MSNVGRHNAANFLGCGLRVANNTLARSAHGPSSLPEVSVRLISSSFARRRRLLN